MVAEDSKKSQRSPPVSVVEKKARPVSKKSHKRPLIQFRGGQVRVDREALCSVSNWADKRIKDGEPLNSVDLELFSPTASKSFIDYVNTKTISGKISFLTLSDLLKIAKKLEASVLTELLEEVLLEQSKKSREFLIQSLLVAADAFLSDKTENSLHALAAQVFLQLAKSPHFYRIPPQQFLMILASCDLVVDDELCVVDATLVWLKKQPYCEQLAVPIFSMIRTSQMDSHLFFRILQRLTELDFPDYVVRDISTILTSSNCARICSHTGPPRCTVRPMNSSTLYGEMKLSDPGFQEGCRMKDSVKNFVGECVVRLETKKKEVKPTKPGNK